MYKRIRTTHVLPVIVSVGLLFGASIVVVDAPAVQAQTTQSTDSLLKRGDRNYSQGHLFKALASYQQALPRLPHNQASHAQTLIKITRIHSDLLEESQALEVALQAVQIYENLADPVGTAEALTQLGDAYLDLDHNDKALDTLQKALTLTNAQSDTRRGRQSLADILEDLGRVHRNLEQYPQAIQFFQQSLALHQMLENQFEIGLLNGYIAGSYILQKQQDEAKPFFQQAHQTLQQVLTDSQKNGNQTLAARTTFILGVNELLENPQRGLAKLQQAPQLFRDLNYRVREADALSTIGHYYRLQAQYGQQLKQEQQALERFQAIGDPINIANSLSIIGRTQGLLSQHSPSVKSYEQVLAIYRQLDQSPLRDRYPLQLKIVKTQSRLGEAQTKAGQYQAAINTLQSGLNPYQDTYNTLRTPEQLGYINLLQQLGDVHSKIDQYAKALTYLNQALTLSQTFKDPLTKLAINTSLIDVYSNLGQLNKVKTLLKQSAPLRRQAFGQTTSGSGQHPTALQKSPVGQDLLKLAQATDSNDVKAIALSTLGSTYEKTGRPEQALQIYQQALSLHRKAGDRPKENLTLTTIGLLHFDQKQYPQALELFEQQLRLSRSLGRQSDMGRALNMIGLIYYQQGQYAQAEPVLRQAVDLWDALPAGLSDQNKISQREIIAGTFTNLLNTLIAQNQTQGALEIAERGRARAFVELLASRSGKNTQRSVKPLTIPQIQQVARDQQATLVEYAILGQQIAIWIVQPTGKIHFVQTKHPKVSLSQLVSNSRLEIGARGRGQITLAHRPPPPQSQPSLRQLHQLLIEPISKYLPTDPSQAVIFIPHKQLFLAPFAALQDQQGRALIEAHTIRSAPSIQVLALTQQQDSNRSARGSALVVGNPTMPHLKDRGQQLLPLPGAEREAIAIANLLNTQAITGSKATKSNIIKQMAQAHFIHLATHGFLDGIQGSDNIQDTEIPGALALAPDNPGTPTDGILTATDIFGMQLIAELVVLSACDTGRGKITGDGVIGLSRSLMAAGVPSVIVSLWKVPDAPTALLMTEFYKHLQQTSNKAQALRQAMLITQRTYPDPMNWAAFILIGNS